MLIHASKFTGGCKLKSARPFLSQNCLAKFVVRNFLGYNKVKMRLSQLNEIENPISEADENQPVMELL